MKVVALLSGLWVGACSVFGVRAAEEPRFTVLDRVGTIEIREYAPRIAAETTISGDEVSARGAGFRVLAGYIFGANHGRETIEMTAPVAQQRPSGAEISMTAPVAQTRGPDGAWTIRFFMPSGASLATLPSPDDARVRLVEVPAEDAAVLRFSGVGSPSAVAARTEEMRRGLEHGAWVIRGEPVAWFYDPPWTLPPLRRNEVAVAVARR